MPNTVTLVFFRVPLVVLSRPLLLTAPLLCVYAWGGRGCRVVTAQYPVSVVFNSHKLKTKVDMVGYREEKRDASGNVTHPAVIVAIELKCTTNTIDVHRQLYDLPCGAGMLSNHLPDTELVHHQLQTAFGVLGVAARVGPKYRVIGRVVVSAADGETSYACSSVYVNERFFMVAPAGGPPARAPKVNCSIQLITMPRNNADRRPILDAFCDTFGAGYKDVVEDHPCKASFVVRHRTTPQKVVAVAIIHDPTDKGTQSAKYKKTRKHIAATASKHGAVPAIMRFVNGGYVVHRVRGG